MKIYILIREYKMTWGKKKIAQSVPHNVASNFCMLLEYQTLQFFKVNINFLHLLKEHVFIHISYMHP